MSDKIIITLEDANGIKYDLVKGTKEECAGCAFKAVNDCKAPQGFTCWETPEGNEFNGIFIKKAEEAANEQNN